jgi:hypothetical protein
MANANDLLDTYLRAQYIPGVYASADFMTLLIYDLTNIRTGDWTARFKALLTAAGA